ncbi:hypothetical protein TWF281_002756 [Arthrobotrys megalospora]
MATSQEPVSRQPPAVLAPKGGKPTEEQIRDAFSGPYWNFQHYQGFYTVLQWLKYECDNAMEIVKKRGGARLYYFGGSTYRRQPPLAKKGIFEFMCEGIKENKTYEEHDATNLMLDMLAATNKNYKRGEDEGDTSNNWLVGYCTNTRLIAWASREVRKVRVRKPKANKKVVKKATGQKVGTKNPDQSSSTHTIRPRVSTIYDVLNLNEFDEVDE